MFKVACPLYSKMIIEQELEGRLEVESSEYETTFSIVL